MNIRTCQDIALVTFGNAIFVGAEPSIAVEPFSSQGLFGFCEFVRFDGNWAQDPLGWLVRLKQEGVTSLRLHYSPGGGSMVAGYHMPERMLAHSVGGGGQWRIEAVGPRGSDFWEARLELGNANRKDKKIWRVTYGRVLRDQPTQPLVRDDATSLAKRLDALLIELEQFSRNVAHVSRYASTFRESRDQLNGLGHAYSLDEVPPGYLSVSTQRLYRAARMAYVFGGMSSWNDGAPEPSAEYDRLSEELYRLLNRIFVATANSTVPESSTTTTN